MEEHPNESQQPARTYPTESQRKAHVKAWQQSGLKRRAYAAKVGIHPGTFGAWIRHYATESTPGFKAVKVTACSPEHKPRAPVAPVEIRKTAQGVQCRFSQLPSATYLATILAACYQ